MARVGGSLLRLAKSTLKSFDMNQSGIEARARILPYWTQKPSSDPFRILRDLGTFAFATRN
jgi:hypothetical protein